MSNWKQRYRSVLKSVGWTNKNVSEITGNSLNSIEVVTTKEDKYFPRWVKSFIVLHEEMVKNGRIVYTKRKL